MVQGAARGLAYLHEAAAGGHSKKLGSAAPCRTWPGAWSEREHGPGPGGLGARSLGGREHGPRPGGLGVACHGAWPDTWSGCEHGASTKPTEGEGDMDQAWVRRTFKEEPPLSEVVNPTLLDKGAHQEESPSRLPRRAQVHRSRPRDAPTHARRRQEPRPEILHPHLRRPCARLRPAPPSLEPLGGRTPQGAT